MSEMQKAPMRGALSGRDGHTAGHGIISEWGN